MTKFIHKYYNKIYNNSNNKIILIMMKFIHKLYNYNSNKIMLIMMIFIHKYMKNNRILYNKKYLLKICTFLKNLIYVMKLFKMKTITKNVLYVFKNLDMYSFLRIIILSLKKFIMIKLHYSNQNLNHFQIMKKIL